METYIILANWTQQGAAHIKEAPARIEAARKAIAAAGGNMLAWYLTVGQYDFIVITEFPDASALARTLLAIGSLGNVRTQTMRAMTEAEFKGLIADMA